MKAVCPSCKKEYDLQDKVCKKCGEPLVIVDEDGFELVDLHQKGQFTSESLNRNTYVEPIEDKQTHPIVKGILILINAIRYCIGGFLVLIGIFGFVIDPETRLFAVIVVVVGITLMPFVYRKLKSQVNSFLYIMLQIIIPFILFVVGGMTL